MKKALAIIISICYLFCALGITLAFHYCGGALKRISLAPDPYDTGCCNTMKKHKCCHDKIVKGEKQDHRSTAKLIVKAVFSVLDIPARYFSHAVRVYKILGGVTSFHSRPPPLKRGAVPLYIFNSVFRL